MESKVFAQKISVVRNPSKVFFFSAVIKTLYSWRTMDFSWKK